MGIKVNGKIFYKKDIDGLTDKNMGRFYKREKEAVGIGLMTIRMVIKNVCTAWRNNVY